MSTIKKNMTKLKHQFSETYYYLTRCTMLGVSVLAWFRSIKWWFFHRFHPKHRYNIIKTGLKPNYYDPDTRIIYGTFNLVTEFVEYAPTVFDFKDTPEHEKVFTELSDAVNWWKENEKLYGSLFDSYEEETKYEDELKKHLTNIINNIFYLWY
jgi:hypothetical protein